MTKVTKLHCVKVTLFGILKAILIAVAYHQKCTLYNFSYLLMDLVWCTPTPAGLRDLSSEAEVPLPVLQFSRPLASLLEGGEAVLEEPEDREVRVPRLETDTVSMSLSAAVRSVLEDIFILEDL